MSDNVCDFPAVERVNLSPIPPPDGEFLVGSRPEVLPDHQVRPEGLLGAIVDHNINTAMRPVRSHALSMAIQTVSLATANKYVVGQFGTRPNIYTLNIGPTGCGKQHQFDLLMDMADEFGMGHCIESTAASGPALHKWLSEQPTGLLAMDEIGHMLAASQERSAAHLKSTVEFLMRVYGVAGKRLAGKRYADSSQNIPAIHCPFMGVMGASTPEKFISALNMEYVYDGLLNRFLVFREYTVPPLSKDTNMAPVPDAISKQLRAINAPMNDTKRPVVIELTEDGLAAAYLYCDEFDSKINDTSDKFRALWSRAFENMLKLSLIHSLGMFIGNPEDAAIDFDSVAWAACMVKSNVSSMAEDMGNASGSSPFELACDKALKAVSNCRNYEAAEFVIHLANGMMPRRKLQQVLRLDPIMFQKVVNELMQTGEIVRVDASVSGGKVVTCYRLGENV